MAQEAMDALLVLHQPEKIEMWNPEAPINTFWDVRLVSIHPSPILIFYKLLAKIVYRHFENHLLTWIDSQRIAVRQLLYIFSFIFDSILRWLIKTSLSWNIRFFDIRFEIWLISFGYKKVITVREFILTYCDYECISKILWLVPFILLADGSSQVLFSISQKLIQHQIVNYTDILRWLREVLTCRNSFLLRHRDYANVGSQVSVAKQAHIKLEVNFHQ